MKEEQRREMSERNKILGIRPPSREGIPHTEETKRKMSLAHKGRAFSVETRKKLSEARKKHLSSPSNNPCYGKPVSQETRKKISQRKKGMTFSIDHRMKLSIALQGKVASKETREKMRKSRSGCNHPMWRGGISSSYRDRRTDRNWREIIKRIYARDDYTCERCEKRGGRLCAHHIVPYILSEDDNDDNLTTLCQSCHIKEELDFYKNSSELRGEPE